MDGRAESIIDDDLVEAILGCAVCVSKALESGFLEKERLGD